MDSTHILDVEEPMTPLTRSATAQSTSGRRRSSRQNKGVAVAQTSQSILRQNLKHKIQESVIRKALPNKSRTTSNVLNLEGTPRQLLKGILQTELVKTPVVHAHAESEDLQPQLPTANSSLESSNPRIKLSGLELPDLTTGNIASTVKGLRGKGPVAQTPQSILRQNLKHKIQESVIRKALPNKRRTTSNVLNLEGTPRQLLKDILQTELVKTPVVHAHAESEDLQPQLPTANSSLESSNPRIKLSGLELPDLTTGNIASTVKGLRGKGPRRRFNVSAFEKQFKEANDIDEDESAGDHSSLSLSSTSLSLNTAFIDVQTKKKGLRRRVSNCRKINEEVLAALNKNHPGVSALVPEQGLRESAYSEGFTLGFSKLGDPDITMDIINCNTALYTKTNDIMSNFSTLATEDKPTVVASQLDVKNNGTYLFPMEEKTLVDSQDNHQTEPADEDATVALQSQSEQEQSVKKLQSHMDIEWREVSGLAESSTRKDASDSEADANVENSFHENDGAYENNPPEDVTEEKEQSGDDYEDEEEEDNHDTPIKTPAFIKEKRNFFFSHPQASSFVKNIKSGDTGLPAAKPKPRIQRKPRAKREPGLPKSYLMNVLKHFAKTKVSPDVYPVLKETMDTFFDRLAKDLEAYALHAGRSTIEVADGILLLKRQGHVNDKVPVEVLIEKFLRMDQRKLLIPIATSGNIVIPKK